ncbi:MAG: phosphoribosylamine--glycine ligase [Bacillota bacterium]
MRILVVGGGGREHALVWKLAQSPRVQKLFAAPGNAGIAELATCVDIAAEDTEGLLALVRQEKIDLTVVGPEAPLVGGLVDAFQKARCAGLLGSGRIFGPTRRAAAIEGSKVFAKELMQKYGIPTARAAVFDNPAAARSYIKELGAPCVVKADGLAAGKGVIVADDMAAALDAVEIIMVRRAFGAAGQRVLIEERLEGEEASVLAFSDGERVLPFLPAQDHKRIFDGDRGPNTGGMGAYAPAPACTPEVLREVEERILLPTVRALKAEGAPYVGVLYAGLMLTADGPKVLEFNARFGDPETQPLMCLMAGDLLELIEAALDGELERVRPVWHPGAAVCVVMAAEGYPGPYRKGDPIVGLADVPPDVVVFHAGTARRDGELVTAGGRVLGVTARGADLAEAVARAYDAAGRIHFAGVHYRHDIGRKGLTRLAAAQEGEAC